MTTARFDRFFLHQTQSKRHGNVREKAWRTLFTLSPVLDLPVRPSTREAGRVGWQLAIHEHPQIPIPLCCPLVSGSPQTGTDSVRTRLVSLIHNSQFRCTEQNRTEPPAKSRSSSHAAGVINLDYNKLKCGLEGHI